MASDNHSPEHTEKLIANVTATDESVADVCLPEAPESSVFDEDIEKLLNEMIEKDQASKKDELEEKAKNILHSCKATSTQRKYQYFQAKFVAYLKEKGVSHESESVLINFMMSMFNEYSPGSLWCIYSIINSWYQEEMNMSIKGWVKVKNMLKSLTKAYLKKKSDTFSPEEIKLILTTCSESANHQDHLMGVGITLSYFGLLRGNEVKKLQVEHVTKREQHYEVHAALNRKTGMDELSYYLPDYVTPMFDQYIATLKNKTGQFLKNMSGNKKDRVQNTGEHTISKFSKKAALMCNRVPKHFTSNCWRRSGATNLANGGASVMNLKRAGNWKSEKVAEGYIAGSKKARKTNLDMLVGSNENPEKTENPEKPSVVNLVTPEKPGNKAEARPEKVAAKANWEEDAADAVAAKANGEEDAADAEVEGMAVAEKAAKIEEMVVNATEKEAAARNFAQLGVTQTHNFSGNVVINNYYVPKN
eukprot:CAMPEP_0195506564 /NCGR_PEP_ID=MMETSP0794_2-20130614/127_1 /TAXON_ID=515487 /ORGANISM="Stephanopyxis turris, Strain CCMP 815" /LENGTH=474 /DNA_ID=CAMNT_0040632901 /DNA_START=383 /DNA_END=1807 /DNA_ORIENTATION=+